MPQQQPYTPQLHETVAIEFTIAGRSSHRLYYSAIEIDTIEQALVDGNGRATPIGQVSRDFGNLGMRPLAVLLWVGLGHANRQLTQKQVFDALVAHVRAGKDLLELRRPINEALILSGVYGQEAIDKLRAPEPAADEVTGAPRPPAGSSETG